MRTIAILVLALGLLHGCATHSEESASPLPLEAAAATVREGGSYAGYWVGGWHDKQGKNWYTLMKVDADGSFAGSFHMSENAPEDSKQAAIGGQIQPSGDVVQKVQWFANNYQPAEIVSHGKAEAPQPGSLKITFDDGTWMQLGPNGKGDH
jgi:hypothetical protein